MAGHGDGRTHRTPDLRCDCLFSFFRTDCRESMYFPPNLGRTSFFIAVASASSCASIFPGRCRDKLCLRASSGRLNSTSSQLSCNQILIPGLSIREALQRSLILFNHSSFAGSSDLQPSYENSITDPSWCFHLTINFIPLLLASARR